MLESLSILYPKERICGLEINDEEIKMVLFEKKGGNLMLVQKNEEKLNRGVVEEGMLKNKIEFVKAVKDFWKKSGIKKVPYVIVSLPSNLGWTNSFNFSTTISEEQINESLEINAAFLLPHSFKEIYSDWQKGREVPEQGKKQIIFSLISKEKADPFIDALYEAGLVPVAFETFPLSLARITDNFKDKTGLLVIVDKNGASICFLKKREVRVSYYFYWKEYEEQGSLPKDKKLEALEKEIFLARNYLNTEKQEDVNEAVLVCPEDIEAELEKILLEKMGIKTVKVILPFFLSDSLRFLMKESKWLISSSAAYRGIVPRERDTDTSLLPVGTEEAYSKKKKITYFSLWSYIISIFLIVFTLVFGVTWLFFSQTEKTVGKQYQEYASMLASSEVGRLEKLALNFNQRISAILEAEGRTIGWSDVLKEISDKTIPGAIVIKRIEVPGKDKVITLTVWAATRETAVSFRDNLKNSSYFTEVEMPIISEKKDITFTISFKINLEAIQD